MNFDISNIKRGVIAGFIATIVFSVLMVGKSILGITPGHDPANLMANLIAQNAGTEPNLTVGWVVHFLIGSVAWGGGFAVLNDIIPGKTQIIKAIMLSIVAWLIMMVIALPMAGGGLFGSNIGLMAPIIPLILHIIFGVVLGIVYSKTGK